MSGENQSRFDELQEKYEELKESAVFDKVDDRAKRLDDRLEKIPDKIQAVRDRGYVYQQSLKQEVAGLAKQWDAKKATLSDKVAESVDEIGKILSRPEALLRNLERQVGNDSMFAKMSEQTQQAVESLEEAVNAGTDTVEGIFGPLEKAVSSLEDELRQIDWVLDQWEDRTFEPGDDENVYLAAEATMKGDNDMKGILFLTSARLIFEQRETTGKRLGMFGGNKEHEVEWETGIGELQSIETENKGVFKGRDMLHFGTGSGEVTVEVKGRADNEYWREQIERMKAGESIE